METYHWIDGSRNNIEDAVSRERAYQDKKWGTIEDHPHTPFEWIGIMEKELAEAKASWFQRGPSTELMIVEVLQVIATGVAMLEQHGVVVDRERYGSVGIGVPVKELDKDLKSGSN